MLASKQVIGTGIIAVGAGITEAAVVFVPPLLVAAFGVTTSKASFMLVPVVIAMAFGSPLAGRMLDKVGSKIVLITGNLLLAAGMLALALESATLFHFYIAGVLIGMGMGMVVGAPLRYIMLNESKPSERAAAQGAIRLFTGIGQLLGGAVVGAVASSHGGGAAGLRIAYLMVGVMAILMFLVSFILKSRSQEIASAEVNNR